MLECLNNIIGIVDTDCTCWDDDKPIDFPTLNASSSGLYVLDSETIPINKAAAAADCSTGGVIDFAIKARDKAVLTTVNEFVYRLNTKLQERFAPFEQIGDSYYKAATPVRSNTVRAGFYIQPNRVKGGKIKITSFDLEFFAGVTGSTDIDISIYSDRDLTTPLATATATITANKTKAVATLSTPYVINLDDIRDYENERFYFAYDLPTGFLPVKQKIILGCNCNTIRKYLDNPFLRLMCEPKGFQTTVTDLSTINTNAFTNGLIVNTIFECDYTSWLCDLATNVSDATVGGRLNLGLALVDVIKARATAYLIESTINLQGINFYTMVLDKEFQMKLASDQLDIFNQGIDYLIQEMPNDVTDCLICKNQNKINKTNKPI